jgi:DNA-directed RNA polymerase subunit RPC12/RpoP
MPEIFTHKCIKCGEEYKDEDPDAYYCSACNEQRKVIAKEVDAKLANVPKHPTKSALQEYDEARGGLRFPSINSLGIKL